MTDAADAARTYLLAEHADLLTVASDCADAVAAGWDGSSTTDREAVAGPLEATLRRAGVLEQLPTVLAGAVDAAGGHLRAQPVPAPPYVVVTSTGPVLRATLDSGRLVVSIHLFTVERGENGEQNRYVRTSGDVADAVSVEFRN
ncbi:hypothetical protein SAMN04487949_1404 [Halogranum gelatinilyticum]|uniref:DUF7988 domain-containing protein n=1 Tax=Halogranum gelatinilyticum TaxID=660521 RepID=A0A1G9SL36_9EURY|nr:hypothetical protein [Halogranum gelatinilyticum]SDM36007.1 hypothetical protein SAMN04487949_1404 [Halogranum gelatinilyticum]